MSAEIHGAGRSGGRAMAVRASGLPAPRAAAIDERTAVPDTHGPWISTPARAKTAALRVITMQPCSRAVAAISESNSDSPTSAHKRPQARAQGTPGVSAPQAVDAGAQLTGPGAPVAPAGMLGLAVAHHGDDRRRAQRAPDLAQQGFVADVARGKADGAGGLVGKAQAHGLGRCQGDDYGLQQIGVDTQHIEAVD